MARLSGWSHSAFQDADGAESIFGSPRRGRRRRGIARALVEYAIEQARAGGASRIDLTANTEKQAGRALYRSLGFQQRDTASFRLKLSD